MRNFILIFLLFNFTLAFSQAQKKVLFIGNSITYFNNMPTLFDSIANEKGKNVLVDMYAPGGTGFVDHVADNNVYTLFKNNIWDIVILQPGSSESAGVSWPSDTTAQRGIQMMDSIKKYSPCAKILLFEIPYGVPSATAYNIYFQVQAQIKDTLTQIADIMQIPFVAAGECARQHYASQQDLLLHNSYNDIHPNLNGSYLIACAMFCAIFQESVSGVNFNGGVSIANATYFQDIADNVILTNKSQWRINTYNLHSEFSTTNVTGSIIDFTNLSTNYTSLFWDFGDGTTSSTSNPQHQYFTSGNKTVTLSAMNNGCTDTFTKAINIILPLDLNKVNQANNLIIYPNPVTTTLNVKQDLSKNIKYKILNITGQEIQTGTINSFEKQISVLSLSEGIYFLQLYDKNITLVQQKFVKLAN
jgi:hypothetical protein